MNETTDTCTTTETEELEVLPEALIFEDEPEAEVLPEALIFEDDPQIEVLPEELIFEDSNSWVEETPPATTAVVRTLAFLADGRTSPFLLRETVLHLVKNQRVESTVVDISTEAGVTIALQLMESGIEYRLFDTVPPRCDEARRPVLEAIRSGSKGVVAFNPGNIAAIDANLVLIPAPASDSGPGLDAEDGTITAVVVEQLQTTKQNCLMILPPEAGLRRRDDGSYVRLTLRLAE